ncbi:MAG TPA: tRNA (guanosine(46)-N7)-methyltransferase TrmB [Candidatus Omnitrophota bacterium]|jgi:tRNA (guanine-N7-)-methyltransferase|nr:tRNA (guanosine(46)-N7)-methyltransferase TrmB [Candidatus Omnitrophota bacterium]
MPWPPVTKDAPDEGRVTKPADPSATEGRRSGRFGAGDEKFDVISYEELFGNKNPVELEIGCGKGKFLTERARENPDTNFLGIDYVSKFRRKGETKVGKCDLANIRFLKAEARKFLTEAVPPASIAVVHIYFPDPWPKRRHHRRRTVTADFLKLIHSRLAPSGLLEIATDDGAYYAEIKEAMVATAELWENVRETKDERIFGGTMKTNYELKFEAEGRTLHYAELRKR